MGAAALGLGGRKLSQAINNSGLCYPVIIHRLPAFIDREEMTSGEKRLETEK